MSPRRAKAVSGRVGDDPATALREHLIDAAGGLLERSPVTQITTRELARSAGVSDGVLYNYFSDKNDLLVAALLRRYETVTQRFLARIPEPGAGTVEQNLTGLACALFDLAGEVVPMIAGLIAEPTLFHRMFVALHEEPLGPQQLRLPLLNYLAAEQRLGRIPTDVDLDAVSLLLMGPTSMLALAAHMAPATVGAPPEDAVRSLVEALMRGLRPAD